jgi:hypothetical protein
MGGRLVTRSTVQLGEKVLGRMPESAPSQVDVQQHHGDP